MNWLSNYIWLQPFLLSFSTFKIAMFTNCIKRIVSIVDINDVITKWLPLCQHQHPILIRKGGSCPVEMVNYAFHPWLYDVTVFLWIVQTISFLTLKWKIQYLVFWCSKCFKNSSFKISRAITWHHIFQLLTVFSCYMVLNYIYPF